jgi:hypothetical protein
MIKLAVKEKAMEDINHPQEKVIETFDHNGIKVDVVEWTKTIWCGKIGYANNNTDEPDVDKIMGSFMALNDQKLTTKNAIKDREDNWDVCMSINYLSKKRPNGMMIGFLVGTDQQPKDFDIYKVLSGKYMRVRICDETAKALGVEPFNGGIPPYQWIGEYIAPKHGYKYGCYKLPVYEYYGFYDPEINGHKYRYLYVPIRKE